MQFSLSESYQNEQLKQRKSISMFLLNYTKAFDKLEEEEMKMVGKSVRHGKKYSTNL